MSWERVNRCKARSRAKYGNASQKCHQGHQHHSVGEARYCNQLELLRKAGEIESYETQVSYRMKVNGKHICEHRPDFRVHYEDGRVEIREYKGFADKVWPLKKKLFEALYPDIPYIVVTQKDLI